MTTYNTAFSMLFTKNVPHIFEKIFLSLDYESFRDCHEVCNAWSEVLGAESLKNKAKCQYSDEMLKDLHEASEKGNLKEVKFLISIGADVNGTRLCGGRPLISAIIGHNNDVVKLLLDAGADPNNAVFTPLRWAVFEGNIEVIKMLLDSGADPNKGDDNSKQSMHLNLGPRSTLFWAALRTNENGYDVTKDVLNLLFVGGAQPTSRDRRMMERHGFCFLNGIIVHIPFFTNEINR